VHYRRLCCVDASGNSVENPSINQIGARSTHGIRIEILPVALAPVGAVAVTSSKYSVGLVGAV
jgi:hypothetical protein